MSPIFWLDCAAYALSAAVALALMLIVLGTGPKRTLNRIFAMFVLAEACWAISALLLRITLWLQTGDPARILELSVLSFALIGPTLLMFTVRYVGRPTRWADLAAGLGLAATAALTLPIFRHQIVFNPRLTADLTMPYYDVSPWGFGLAVLPAAHMAASVALFWRNRHRTQEPHLAAGVLILLAGFIIGGLLQPRFPVMSLTTTLSVAILGYEIVSRQILNPLRELTTELERKVDERTRALAEERNFVSTVLDTAQALVVVLDTEGRIVRFNRACEKVTGYSFDEVCGQRMWDLLLIPEDRPSAWASADVDRASADIDRASADIEHGNTQRGGFPRERESYLLTKDGDRRLIAWSSSPLRDDDGAVEYTVGTGIDVTERARIEAVRAQAEEQLERYADVANNMQVGLQIYHLEDPADDRTLRLITTNPAAAQFTGLLPEEAVGKTFDEIFPRLQERGIPQAYADVVRTGLPVELEQEVYYGSGDISDAWLSVKAFPLPGNCVGILSEDITLQKQAEESLRRSTARYQAILEDQTELICRMLPDGTLTFVNEATCRYFGQKHEDLIGKSYTLPIFEEDRPKVREHIAALTAENPLATYEHRVIGPDGETRWLRWTARAIFDEQGRRDEVQSVGWDITEGKRAMQALRESEERFRTLFDGIPACCWTFDRDGTILDWNLACETLYGWTAEQAVGETMYDLMVKDENVVATRETVGAVFQGRSFRALEYEDVRADGTTCNVLANEYPIKDSQGRVIMGVCAELDITERVRSEAIRAQAEEALAERAAQLALINDVGRQIAAVSDVNSVLERTVQLVQETFGYHQVSLFTVDRERGEVVDAALAGAYAALFPHGYRQKLDDGIIGWVARHSETLLANDVTVDPRYVDFLLEDSRIATRSELAVPIRLGQEAAGVLDVQSPRLDAFDGNDVMTLEILADQIAVAIENARLYGALELELGERKRAEERLEQYAAELEQSNQEIKQFAYIVSHDLRAPLVNLKGFAAELRAALAVIGSAVIETLPHLDEKQQHNVALALEEDVPEALQFIDASVSRMDGFINAVLKLSRLGRRELKPEPIDTEALVRANLGALAHQIEGGGVRVTVGPLPQVVADRTSMEQIWGNLLGNAVKYLDPDRPGEIEITAEAQHDETTFHVRDNGRGVAADDMDKVFAPFRRAGKQDVPGEGMGLAYVQTLIRRHGGRIWCESEPGVGTTFSFTIPNQHVRGDNV